MGTKKFPGLGHFLWWGTSRCCCLVTYHLSVGDKSLGPGVEGEDCSGHLLSEVIPIDPPLPI